jgi:uncharacterized OB-fold protein
MKTCTNCGYHIGLSAEFCPNCGVKAPKETDGERRRKIMTDRVVLVYKFRVAEAELNVAIAKYQKGDDANLAAVHERLADLHKIKNEIAESAEQEAAMIVSRSWPL